MGWKRSFGLCSMLLLSSARHAFARPPVDDFLNPHAPGQALVLMPFVGPGFRAAYDRRFAIEQDMSELRLQLMGTVTVPFSEISAHLDARFFLMTFGASAGYHDEWHLLRFNPDPQTGRDRAGQSAGPEPPTGSGSMPAGPAAASPTQDSTATFVDLDRDARAVKDAHGDVGTAHFPFFEGRVGFLWPAYNFLSISTFTLHHDDRPDVSYDWETATVMSHGTSYRWEGYFLLRERNTGFLGPALTAFYVPRNRVEGNPTIGTSSVVVPNGSACQMDEAIPCHQRYEFEFHYGILAGLRPSIGPGEDTLLVRAYATFGFDNRLFGSQAFRQPLSILVAYMANVEL